MTGWLMVSSLKTVSSSKGAVVGQHTGALGFDDDIPEFEYQEYEYEPDSTHLTESEAADRYKTFKAQHPGAIVHLDQLACGHYAVNLYLSDHQKDRFYYQTYLDMVRSTIQRILGPFGHF